MKNKELSIPLEKLEALKSFLVDIENNSEYSGWKILAREQILSLSEDPDIYDILHRDEATGTYNFPDFLFNCPPEKTMTLITEIRKKFSLFEEARY